MKHKYITSQIMLGCLSTKAPKNNIYIQLEKTIEERKRIMKQLFEFSIRAKMIDIYTGSQQAA